MAASRWSRWVPTPRPRRPAPPNRLAPFQDEVTLCCVCLKSPATIVCSTCTDQFRRPRAYCRQCDRMYHVVLRYPDAFRQESAHGKEHMAKSAQAFLAKCFRRSDLPDEPPAVRIRPSAEELLRDDFVSSWVAD